ncbi:Monopolin complex, subunit Csm1/Pcs1 [Lasallia pustulata]|uniref:Monopolin complex, subunit Csm1/Pcs1 n=1 Tax=Lasallia pustulata TaxID=136370 RepID=A0A1W5DC78_9LECA|nr:Monopolin complex, subunit Csm1/Pcs1 [Lasallia pustulata]
MPKAKAIASLSRLIDTDIEDSAQHNDVGMMLTPDSNQENAAPARRNRGRPKAASSKFSKPKRRVSGFSAASKKAGPAKKAAAKRAPLKDQANQPQASDTEVVDDLEDHGQDKMDSRPAIRLEEPDTSAQLGNQKGKRGRPAAKPKQAVEDSTLKKANATEKDGEFEYTPTIDRKSKGVKKASAAKKPAAGKTKSSVEPALSEKVIPETQQAPMDIDGTVPPEEDEDVEETAPQSVFRQARHGRTNSRQPQAAVARRRAGSASDNERTGSDAATRRKLGEMTKKFENLDLKFRNLREVGIKEAEANFEKLRKQSEDRTNAANDLIASLRSEVAAQKVLAQESRALQKQVSSKDAELAKAQAIITQLNSSLSESQNENKALQAKLAASRTASASVESVHAKTPGSAMKGKGQTRTIMIGSAEAALAAQVAQLKEDLYSDLTGLILRGVERGDDADVYDCIQTGRNGTLHFKLAVASDSDGKGSSYEETEIQYTPRLDSNRDRDLLELLPDYLSEEITFSRMNAPKFYGRVVDTLTKRRNEEE